MAPRVPSRLPIPLTRAAPLRQAAAELRADAFYEDLAERQALPFPKRFLPTFQREFAERARAPLMLGAPARLACSSLRTPTLTPLPRRHVAREQEIRSLELRTRGRVGASLACTCLVAVAPPAHDDGPDAPATPLLGCLDVSWKTGPCGSSINGQCVAEGEEFCYLDNVCVAPQHRRSGVASALLAAASDAGVAYGARRCNTSAHLHHVMLCL